MYKVTIGLNGYSLLQLDLSTGKYKRLVIDSSVETIKKYSTVYLGGGIRLTEIDLAIKDLSDSMYNTAEFGGNGFYTVPYYDENVI
jgi:hypothetical protein